MQDNVKNVATVKESYDSRRKERKWIRGITLITLIITVIVLLILAGVALNFIIGENGILSYAKYAREKYENKAQIEQNELEQLSSLMVANGSNLNISMEKLEEIIDKRVQKAVQGGLANPTGTVISYMGNNVPEGYLSCNGTEYNISEYSNLAEQIKSEFGSYNYFGGDGTTTFAVPNLQGEFLRGTGTNSYSDGGNGGIVGEHQGGTRIPRIAINSGTAYTYMDNSLVNSWGEIVGNTQANIDKEILIPGSNLRFGSIGTINTTTTNASAQRVSNIVRPTNTSVLYCIKY